MSVGYRRAEKLNRDRRRTNAGVGIGRPGMSGKRHNGYFRNAFVERRWLDERASADLLALVALVRQVAAQARPRADQMATEKLSDSVRIFNADLRAPRTVVGQRLAAAARGGGLVAGFAPVIIEVAPSGASHRGC